MTTSWWRLAQSTLVRFNLTQHQFLSDSTTIMLCYTLQKSVLIHAEGGLYYCRGLNSSIIVPTMGGKRRWPPARHPVIPTHKRRPGALRHNQGLSDFHDMTDYWHFTHYSARNIDNNRDDNEDDQLSRKFNKGQKRNWMTPLIDFKIHVGVPCFLRWLA